jgi:hypothetical protein
VQLFSTAERKHLTTDYRAILTRVIIKVPGYVEKMINSVVIAREVTR